MNEKISKEVTYEDIEKANKKIKATNIKGKNYAEVNQRIKAFKMVYPNGTIETEMISNVNGVCIFRAYIYSIMEKDYYQNGQSFERKNLLATGTAYEKEDSSFINKTSYIENCETSAVGRALGNAGFGIDTSIASAEDMKRRENIEMEENIKLLANFEELIIATDTDRQNIFDHFKVKNNSEMTNLQLKQAINILKQKPMVNVTKKEVF